MGAGAIIAAVVASTAASVYSSQQASKQAKNTALAQMEADERARQEAALAQEEADARTKQTALDQQTSETATVDYGKDKAKAVEYQDSSDLLIPKQSMTLGTGGTTRTGIGF